MKEIKCILKKSVWLFAVVSAMFFAGCQDEDDQQNNNNNSTTDYPASADVIYNAVTDIDGNTYDAVRIGDQIWMASNLRTTHYANGDTILKGDVSRDYEPHLFSYMDAYPYEYDLVSFGYLYNEQAVMHSESYSNANPSGVQGICPNGWHVPSNAEWKKLEDFLSSQSQYVCGDCDDYIAKSLASNYGWKNWDDGHIDLNDCAVGQDLSSNNATGFSAIPAGTAGGEYGDEGWYGVREIASFWSSSIASDYSLFLRELHFDSKDLRLGSSYLYSYHSVRCIKD